MPKRFASWAAVSSERQAEEISLDYQREVNLQVIQRHDGILVADLIVDESRDIDELSEACERIPEYATLRHLIKNNGVDVVVLYTRSRLGRVMALVETIAQLCRRHGVVLYETDTPPTHLEPEANNDTELLTGAMRSWKSQQEINELKRRNKMGMLGKFKKGEFLNGVPWGWKGIYDVKGRLTGLVVDEVAARTIRMGLITLYCEKGVGATYIGEELNQLGMYTATGKEWTRRTASNLFRMLWRYAGYNEINYYSRHKRRPYARDKGNWPAIIAEEELHRILTERKARRGKRGVGNAATYRFSLMVYCAVCGRRMTSTYQTRAKGKRVIYATCENTDHKERNILMPVIAENVRDFFELLQDPDAWPQFLNEDSNGTAEIDKNTERIHEEIRKAEHSIHLIDDKLVDGTFDDTRHAHQVRRVRERIEQLQHELTILNDRCDLVDHASRRRDRIQEIAEHGMSYLDMPDERAANSLLRPLIRIWAKDRKVSRIDIL